MRAEWLRLRKSWFGYACVAGCAALTLAATMANAGIMMMGNDSRWEGAPSWALSPFEAYGLASLSFGIVVVMAGWMITELVAGDCYSGSIKNLVQGSGGRRAYATMVVVFACGMAALLVLVGIVCAEVGCWFEGVALQAVSLGERALWYVQAVSCVAAYAVVTAWAVAATGSRMTGMALALLLGTGLLNTLLAAALESVGVLAPASGRYVPGSLGACLHSLQEGVLPGWNWIIPVAVVFGVGTFGIVRALARKGLA